MLERKHKGVLLEGELPALHWKQGHARLDLMVQDLKNYILALEEKMRESREEGEAKVRSNFAMTQVSYDEQEALQHRQPVLTGLKRRIEYKARLREALEVNGHIYSKQKEWWAISNFAIL